MRNAKYEIRNTKYNVEMCDCVNVRLRRCVNMSYVENTKLEIRNTAAMMR